MRFDKNSDDYTAEDIIQRNELEELLEFLKNMVKKDMHIKLQKELKS